MSELPPVLDFSDDPEGFAAHLRAELAKPCQHCDQIAPTRLRLGFGLSGDSLIDYVCAACGERRARFYPG